MDNDDLVGGYNLPLWEVMEWVKVSWDDEIYEIPNRMETYKMFQTTNNQIIILYNQGAAGTPW